MSEQAEKENGGFAFPWGEHGTRLGGATMRDLFAIAALPAVINNCIADTKKDGISFEDFFAKKSYELADAMLEARKQ